MSLSERVRVEARSCDFPRCDLCVKIELITWFCVGKPSHVFLLNMCYAGFHTSKASH